MLVVVVGLLALNYWHATRCGGATGEGKTPDEVETYVEGINRRLMQAESLTVTNGHLVDKLLVALQTKLAKLDPHEMEELTRKSQDDAVRLAIQLAGQPAPPMPEFDEDPDEYVDDKGSKGNDKWGYNSRNSSSNGKYDDVRGSARDDYSEAEREEWGKYDKDKWDDKEFSYKKTAEKLAEEPAEETLTDAEATKLCSEWKDKYAVVVGVSWGQLPFDLQRRWLKISCDYHFRDTKLDGSSSSSSGNSGSSSTPTPSAAPT